jgi:hypothetical protein
LGGLDKVRYTREGIEALIKQAEIDQDADQFVVSMKIVALRWWMSHLQVGISFSSSAGVLRYLLHNLQIIGLKFLKIQENEKIEKAKRREKVTAKLLHNILWVYKIYNVPSNRINFQLNSFTLRRHKGLMMMWILTATLFMRFKLLNDPFRVVITFGKGRILVVSDWSKTLTDDIARMELVQN